jgi:hypothetical protein
MAFARIILRTADGAEYGPITREVLSQWSAEGRVPLDATLVDVETGETRPVSALLSHSDLDEAAPASSASQTSGPMAFTIDDEEAGDSVPAVCGAGAEFTPGHEWVDETPASERAGEVTTVCLLQDADVLDVESPQVVQAPAGLLTDTPEAPLDLLAGFAEPSPAINADELLAVAPPHLPKRRRGGKVAVLAGGLVVLLGMAGAGYYLWSTDRLPFLPNPPASTTTPAPPAPPAPAWTIAHKELIDETWIYTIATDDQDLTQLESIAQSLPEQETITLKPGPTSEGQLLTVFFIPAGQTPEKATAYKSVLWDPGQGGWVWRVK